VNSQEPCGSRNLHFGEVSLFSLIAASSYRASIGADRLYAEHVVKSSIGCLNKKAHAPVICWRSVHPIPNWRSAYS